MSIKITTNQSKTYKISQNHLYSEVADEAVILDLESGVYYGLNSVGVDIWQWLQQPQTEEKLLDLVLEEYEVTPEQAEQDLQSILKEMLKVGLLEVSEEEILN
ncbi:MAG: PqqD family protein [Pleurocapsa sp. SU_5_0]|nr:PqqD family protein [Pleurocapsa sp. SU_5_0]NJR45518.1 PqqD family protein [Hyellaceae cyanobacterium CSU_1_1]